MVKSSRVVVVFLGPESREYVRTVLPICIHGPKRELPTQANIGLISRLIRTLSFQKFAYRGERDERAIKYNKCTVLAVGIRWSE